MPNPCPKSPISKPALHQELARGATSNWTTQDRSIYNSRHASTNQRKNATFAERRATVGQSLIERRLESNPSRAYQEARMPRQRFTGNTVSRQTQFAGAWA
ncbi:MAG: hypothetical protein NXI32_22415 [bacterium]|nr:hypothetical protein [bacterium]